MILDSRDEKVNLNRSVQIAIVGAGPAGLTLANELADLGPVLVIESGGFEVDADLQALQIGECVGIDYPLTETRTRQFGGSSALWAGYCAVFDSHDFTHREWVPGSGWPFGVEAIKPYYEKTAKLLNIDDLNFDPRDIARRAEIQLPFDNEIVIPTVWRFGTPTVRISEHHRDHFDTSKNVITLTHANVVDIRLDAEHSMASTLKIRTLSGREGHISADIFVLACGGIETARILLNSDTQVCHGLGNANDWVGRNFMEHPHLSISALTVERVGLFKNWLERGYFDEEKQFLLCVGLSERIQKEAQILNARAHIYRTPSMSDDETPKVGMFLEQAPNPNSRLTLSDRTDSLGMRRVRLDWRLTELDWKSYEKTANYLSREFERINVGKVRDTIHLIDRDDSLLLHSNHHLGTTRMSRNKADGVVDSNSRMHDYSNIYIAGGSVFPSASWANPTFTLIALTLRLADHIRTKLEQVRGG
ncbi:GMC family oxidoreductase [Methylomarinum sp. Ch1-1]|uniref:GMC family oxidoreductase n=1 Tax=Methylomarinum roseum TaxID=3067653 RepID=A0AAU7NRW7_9GAMM|nr:GMC family oxidoreductase [Methylomarinum sp. Ch1-1]MDP4520290.1 GMC family oxidoreductase [Methylomarinum sp. Ch1-1]